MENLLTVGFVDLLSNFDHLVCIYFKIKVDARHLLWLVQIVEVFKVLDLVELNEHLQLLLVHVGLQHFKVFFLRPYLLKFLLQLGL